MKLKIIFSKSHLAGSLFFQWLIVTLNLFLYNHYFSSSSHFWRDEPAIDSLREDKRVYISIQRQKMKNDSIFHLKVRKCNGHKKAVCM